MSLLFIQQHTVAKTCQVLTEIQKYSKLVTNNSWKSSNYCCSCGL